VKDDEDEGLRREAEPISLTPGSSPTGRGARGEGKKIERSADALRGCHSPAFFPSEKKSCHNANRVTGATNRQEMAKKENRK
jgi:hypothetical protein